MLLLRGLTSHEGGDLLTCRARNVKKEERKWTCSSILHTVTGGASGYHECKIHDNVDYYSDNHLGEQVTHVGQIIHPGRSSSTWPNYLLTTFLTRGLFYGLVVVMTVSVTTAGTSAALTMEAPSTGPEMVSTMMPVI